MKTRIWNFSIAVLGLSLTGCSATIGFVPIGNIQINPTFDYRTTEINPFSGDSGNVKLIRKAFQPESCSWKAIHSPDSSFQKIWQKVFGLNFYQNHKADIDSGIRIEFTCQSSDTLGAELITYADCASKKEEYKCYSHTRTGVAIDRRGNTYEIAFKK